MSINLLSQQNCSALHKDSIPLSLQEISSLRKEIPEWQILDSDLIKKLSCTFVFKNFSQAILFTNSVAALAEEQNHHPQILTEWGKVTVIWWSHAVNGLHKNDFIMAARTSKLYLSLIVAK